MGMYSPRVRVPKTSAATGRVWFVLVLLRARNVTVAPTEKAVKTALRESTLRMPRGASSILCANGARQKVVFSLRKEVSLTVASWNLIGSWLARLDGLRRAA